MSVEEILIKLIEAVDPNAYKVKSRNEAMTSLHSLLISKLPEKKPLVLEKEYSTPRELLPQEQEIKLNTNHQVIGFNQAVDNMNRVIDEMFEVQK